MLLSTIHNKTVVEIVVGLPCSNHIVDFPLTVNDDRYSIKGTKNISRPFFERNVEYYLCLCTFCLIVSHMAQSSIRCVWAKSNDILISYHDEEWGVPVRDDRLLFEMLTLEGAQAGLSWVTILKRRQQYLLAFDHFDINKIAHYGDTKVTSLLEDKGIIRNKLKIAATIKNAKAALLIQKEWGSIASYLWHFVGDKPVKHSFTTLSDYPTKILQAEEMSRDLLKRGFTFVGPTICYAFMQAVGMVNDHQVDCFRYNEV